MKFYLHWVSVMALSDLYLNEVGPEYTHTFDVYDEDEYRAAYAIPINDDGNIAFDQPKPIGQKTISFKYLQETEDILNSAEKGVFFYNQMPIRFHVWNAPNPRAVLACSSGFKYPSAIRSGVLNEALERGYSVINMELPNPGTSLDFLDLYEDITDFFFLNENSPIFTEMPAHLPRIIWGHSTGGLMVSEKLYDPIRGAEIADAHAVAVNDAGFFDCTNASMFDKPINQILFHRHARKNIHATPVQTIAGAFYTASDRINLLLNLRGIEGSTYAEKLGLSAAKWAAMIQETINLRFERPFETDDAYYQRVMKNGALATPTFGQILELQERGQTLVRQSTEEPRHTPIPTFYVSGKWDQSASPKAIEAISTNFCAKHFSAAGGHAPTDDDAITRATLFDAIDDALPKPVHSRLTSIVVTGIEWGRHIIPGQLRTALGGLTHQSGTRALDTTAGLLKGPLGGGVGNAEVGGQAESRAVNGSHALRL